MKDNYRKKRLENDLAVLSSVSPVPIELSKNIKFKRFPFTEENIQALQCNTNLKTIVLIQSL